MKAALYARVSTADKDQDPETQLHALRDYCQRQGISSVRVYVDRASARDIAHRTAWRELLKDAARSRFKAVIVFKLDRAFRSVKDMHDALTAWDLTGVIFISTREDFNSDTAVGRLMRNMLASVAEFELEMIRERVKAGIERRRAQGKPMGRPNALRDVGPLRLNVVLMRVEKGELSQVGASRELNVSRGTVQRELARRAETFKEGRGVKTASPV